VSMALWSAMVVLPFGVVGVVFLGGSCKSSESSESRDSRSVKYFPSVVSDDSFVFLICCYCCLCTRLVFFVSEVWNMGWRVQGSDVRPFPLALGGVLCAVLSRLRALEVVGSEVSNWR
jgi:hypothetical protein